jgi:hypothetical protein
MGMNGIIFEYTNEYRFHADLIYKWLFVKLLPMVSYNRSTSCLKYFYPTSCIKGEIYDPIVYLKAEESLLISDTRLLTLYMK